MYNRPRLTPLLAAKQALSIIFLSCFVAYSGAALIFLAAGFAPFLTDVFPLIRNINRGLANGAPAWVEHMPALSRLATRVRLQAAREWEPPVQVILQYAFSLLNLTLGIFLIWLRPRDRAAGLLALGMIGTGAVFNRQAHSAQAILLSFGDFAHDNFHLISGVAYVYGLLLFPDGRLPRWPLPRWLMWPLRVVYLSFFTLVGLMLVSIIHGEPEGLILFFGLLIPISGITAQIFRYRYAANITERQQSKALLWALTMSLGATLIVGSVTVGLTRFDAGIPRQTIVDLKRFIFLAFPPLFAVIPVTLFMVMIRYHLWDIDVIIKRTLVYSALTGALALIYVASVLLLHQQLFGAITDGYSQWTTVASALLIAALFLPLRRRVQAFIDRSFYREKVDFRRAFADFAHEVRMIVDLPDLVRALVNRTTELLHITHGAVFLRGDAGDFYRAAASGLVPGHSVEAAEQTSTLRLARLAYERLQAGNVVAQPRDQAFPLLVPLRVPRASSSDLVGVLALGPRRSGQDYSSEDQGMLLGLADQAGTALHVAQLIGEQQAEARRREESERHLAAYHASPVGRADMAAQALQADPETALLEIYRLANQGGDDPEVEVVLDHLPEALRMRAQGLLSGIAMGYHFIVRSRSTPVFLPVGLRNLIERLQSPTAESLRGRQEALGLYQRCLQAFEAGSLVQMTRIPDGGHQPPSASNPADPEPELMVDLWRALNEMQAVAEMIRAAERVDTPQDKLAYLAGAVERLSRVDRQAHSELGSADRSIVLSIVDRWLTIISGAIRELQTRARISCQVLTRQVYAGERVSLALSLRNSGHGAALNLRAGLARTAVYRLLAAPVVVDRLNPDEETRVEVCIAVNSTPDARSVAELHIHGSVEYDDQRGPNQLEHFAGLVSVLPAELPYQFIPNPYVVGTPLRTGSPLFVGREDQIAYVQQHLQAAHRNNLVLMGQRRTGKTSLLKQLLARLDDAFLPIYLDGQALGLDPGLPNFFLAIATEIMFALEDRGFQVEAPEPGDFVERPAATFEYQFLSRVRAAIGARHLLIMLDEFEELEAAVRRGSLDASIFGFLRHLIQHTQGLSLIFCGTHHVEELSAEYRAVLANNSLYRQVGFLEQPEALRLIQEPVAEFGMRYDDLALEKIWRMTAGHPYFLQMLCYALVQSHNRMQRSYMTIADVNAALDDLMATGEAHFVYLWTESTPDERLVLAALSRLAPPTTHVTPADLTAYLAERGYTIEHHELATALDRLTRRDILRSTTDQAPAHADVYSWRLGLLGLWVERYQTLSRVLSRVQR